MAVAYTSGQISFSGLGSGTDFNSMITKLMDIEATHAKQLQSWKEDWEVRISAFQELNTKMLNLQNSLSKISKMNTFLTKDTTISSSVGTNILSATLGDAAETGSHNIEVGQLAQNSIYMNNTGIATSNKSMGLSGTFEYTYTAPGKAAVTRTLNVDSSTTLEGLCNQINNDPENPGVKASIVRNGDKYYMQLRGMDLGDAANLTLGNSTLPGFEASKFTQVQVNQDSKIKVDGWPPTSLIAADQPAILTSTRGSADSTEALGVSGDFKFSYTVPGGGSTTVTVGIEATDSLENIRDKINSNTDNNGVTASLVEKDGKFYLEMTGDNAGAEANVTILAGTAYGFDAASFSQTQRNLDAGEDPLSWITTSNNTVGGVIPGVTLNLLAEGMAQMTVSVDRAAVEENINEFVGLVNEVRTIIQEMTKVTTVSTEQVVGSALTGNYGVQLIKTRLAEVVTGTPPGFAAYNSTTGQGDLYSSLGMLGIRTDARESSPTNGLLYFDTDLLDEDSLKKALDENIEAVAALFAADGVGSQLVNQGNFSFYSKINKITAPGSYEVKYDIDADGKIINATIGGKPANVNQDERTITSVNGDSKGIMVKVNDLTPNTKGEGVVQLKQGLVGYLSDTIADITKDGMAEEGRGSLKILEERYKDIVANIDSKIEREQERLIVKERFMRNRFARLESLLGTYDQTSQALARSISQLSTPSSN